MKDARHAKYLENIVSNKDLVAFICEDADDVKKFMHQMHAMKLTVNIFHIVHEHSSAFQPQYSIDRYKYVDRVRMILVLAYWLLGNIHGYWVVLCIGGYFCHSDTQYNTNQTAVSAVHMPVNDYLVSLVTCTPADAIVCLDTTLICIVVIIEF